MTALELLHLTHYKQLLSAEERAKLEATVVKFLKSHDRGLHNVGASSQEFRGRPTGL